MAEIRPFVSIRPKQGKAAEFAALPYDVYNREEAKKVVKENPASFLKIDRAETQFPDSVDLYDDRVYRKAHDLLWEAVAEGTLIKEDKRCYYIYELTMDGRAQTGIVACASLDDYQNGVIKKHENTRAEKEADRIRHVDSCNAQTGPIFLAYRANPVLHAITEKVKNGRAEYDFVSEDGIRHRCFVIRDEETIAQISSVFSGMEQIYIADGHHRAASAVKVGLKRRMEHVGYTGEEEFNYFLSVLFPDDELRIMDYNRVVKDLNGISTEKFLQEVRTRFMVTALTGEPAAGGEPVTEEPGSEEEEAERLEAVRPKERGTFSMYLDGQWYSCRIRPENRRAGHPVADLDVSILQEKLLAPVLGITDPKTDTRIDFVGGIRGLEELVRRCRTDCAVAFAMYPTSIAELFAVADAGLLMPPKSTWFEPKLRSGLFIHEI